MCVFERECVVAVCVCACVCVYTNECMCGWHGGGKGNQLHELVYDTDVTCDRQGQVYIYLCKFYIYIEYT